ncbi:MAG: hypothetical protein OHK0053_17980 [Microscillaceae bacterium]
MYDILNWTAVNEKSAYIENMFEANGCPKHTFLVAYVKNSLSEAERAAIEEHLNHCKHLCEAFLEGLYLEELTQAALQNEPSLREGLDQEALFRKVEPLLKKPLFVERKGVKKKNGLNYPFGPPWLP